MKRDRTPRAVGAALLALLAGGMLLPPWLQFLLTIALAQGLVALSLALLLRAGLLSFGQALYYCLGAYAAGVAGQLWHTGDMVVQMACACAAAALTAWVLGYLLARYRGIYFGLLSLALSMILYGLLVKSEALGSTDGFNIPRPSVLGLHPQESTVRYVVLAVAAVVSAGAALAVHRYLETPLGRLAPAIRDNEIRVEYMGASARAAVHVKYVIAAVLAALGGAIAAATVGHIDPDMAYWTTSGEFVFIAILAGTGSVLAPFLGAIVYGLIHSVAYGLSPNTWQLTLGSALLLVIAFLPEGLWSLGAHRRSPS